MSSEWQEYVKDPRTICKYGAKCYQQNPEHHASYKHPPNMKNNRGKHNRKRNSPYSRDDKPTRDDKLAKKTDVNTKAETVNTVTNEHPVSRDEDVSQSLVKIPSDLSYYSADDRDIIKELFLVEMPDDFYKFYECLNDGDSIVKTLSSVNLQLIGPYELLLGKLPVLDDKELYLVHWRFFYDPPEFQAVIKGKGEYHIGYYRDDPNEAPVFVASNDSSKDYHIKPIADNIFGAVFSYLQNEKKSSPFTAMHCQKLMDKIKKYAEEHQFPIEEYKMKKRLSKIICKTFHGAGIVVPYNKKTQLGYRRLVESDATIKKLFENLKSATTQAEKDKVLSDLQPIITYASIAVDECDFGTGIEVGVALFCSGLKELEPSALSSLTAAYSLLNREPFAKIIRAHLKHRRRGPNMSVIDFKQ